MSYTNSGVEHPMSDGVPGHLVLNRKGGTDTRKEGTDTRNRHPRGVDWPTRKGKRQAGVGTLGATKNPAGVNLRGGVGVIGLPAVARKGR